MTQNSILLNILSMFRNCTDLFERNRFNTLVKQIQLYLPMFPTNQETFRLAFLDLDGNEKNLLLQVFSYLSKQNNQEAVPLSPIQPTMLDELYCILVDSRVKADASGSKNWDLFLAIETLDALVVLPQKNYPKTYAAFSSLFQQMVLLKKNLILYQLSNLIDKIIRVPGSYTSSVPELEKILFFILPKPSNKWFVFEQLIYFFSKRAFKYLVRSQPLKTQLEAYKLLFKNDGEFPFEFLLTETLKKSSLGVFLVILLSLWLSFSVAQASSVPAFPLNNMVQTDANFLGVAASAAIAYSSKQAFFKGFSSRKSIIAYAPGQPTPEPLKLLKKPVCKLEVSSWLLYNNVRLKQTPAGDEFLFNGTRDISIALQRADRVNMRKAFRVRQKLINYMQNSAFYELFWLSLNGITIGPTPILKVLKLQPKYKQKPQTKPKDITYTSLTAEDQALFKSFCIQFVLTLMPNSQGSLSMSGSVYPYDIAMALKRIFKALFRLLEQQIPFDPDKEANNHLQKTDLSNPLAYHFNNIRNEETMGLEACHLFPLRVRERFDCSSGDFLAILLPQELNSGVESKAFDHSFWLLPIDQYGNDTVAGKLCYDSTDNERFTSMVKLAIKKGWDAQIKALKGPDYTKDKPLFGKMANFSPSQENFILQSYIKGTCLYSDKDNSRVPTYQIAEFETFSEITKNLVGAEKNYVFVTERLLHDNALDVMAKFWKPNIIKVLQNKLSYVAFEDMSQILADWRPHAYDPTAEAIFFQKQKSIEALNSQIIEKTIQPTLNKIVFSFIAITVFYNLYFLRTLELKRIVENPSFSDYSKNAEFENSVSSLFDQGFKQQDVAFSMQCFNGGLDPQIRRFYQYTGELFTRLTSYVALFSSETIAVRQRVEKGLTDIEDWCTSEEFVTASELKTLSDFRVSLINYYLKQLSIVCENELSPNSIKVHYMTVFRLLNKLTHEYKSTDTTLSLAQLNEILSEVTAPCVFDIKWFTGLTQNNTLDDVFTSVQLSTMPKSLLRTFNLHLFLTQFIAFRELYSIKGTAPFSVFSPVSSMANGFKEDFRSLMPNVPADYQPKAFQDPTAVDDPDKIISPLM